MDPATIATIIGTVKTLADLRILTKKLGERVPAEVREQISALYEQVSDLQGAALAAQQREIDLTARCREVEAELGRVNDWETEKERYTLQLIGGTAPVYVQKLDVDAPAAPHWLCANCFEDRRKSHLQLAKKLVEMRNWRCARCEAFVLLDWQFTPGG